MAKPKKKNKTKRYVAPTKRKKPKMRRRYQ